MPTATDWDGIAVGKMTKDMMAHPEWVQLTKTTTPPVKDRWYRYDTRCIGNSKTWQCDEYPFNSTTSAGGNAALQLVPKSQNASEGGFLVGFYNKCGVVDGTNFLTVPMVFPGAPPTFSVCGS